jgi:uncharacterized lipoprotein YajG
MKKINLLILFLLLTACTKTPETPIVTIANYSEQVVVMNGVVTKILDEKDPKIMYQMANAIESSRAVACKPVGEECNLYYQIINKVVSMTKEGKITDDQRMELFKMKNEFQEEVRKGELKIRELWKAKISGAK